MKSRFILLLAAPLAAWAQECVCGRANQDSNNDRQAVLSSPRQPRNVNMYWNAVAEDKRSDAVTTFAKGTPTGEHEYPFVAALVYTAGTKRVLCAGAIIDEKHVLAAAHCVNGLRANSISVHVGSSTYSDAAQLVPVAAINTHPKWDAERLRYDVALVQLKDALRFDQRVVNSVCVPAPRSLDKQAAVAVAWSADGQKAGSAALVQAKFEIHDLASCKAKPTGGPQLCAYAAGQDTCDGASGGSVLLWREESSKRYFAVGVASYGQACEETPEVATDVAQLRDWMGGVLAKNGGKFCP